MKIKKNGKIITLTEGDLERISSRVMSDKNNISEWGSGVHDHTRQIRKVNSEITQHIRTTNSEIKQLWWRISDLENKIKNLKQ